MLFLLRPRQTLMPYERPRSHTEQGAYNRKLQERFDATRQVAVSEPMAAAPGRDMLAELRDLGQLRASGALSEQEFTLAKARLLGDAGGQ